jgi:hypothetical protein
MRRIYIIVQIDRTHKSQEEVVADFRSEAWENHLGRGLSPFSRAQVTFHFPIGSIAAVPKSLFDSEVDGEILEIRPEAFHSCGTPPTRLSSYLAFAGLD